MSATTSTPLLAPNLLPILIDLNMSSYSASAAADNLRKLLALVNESAEDAIRQYEQADVVPSLDTTEHLKLPGDSLALKKTLRTLEAASHQMISTLVPPMLTMYSVGTFPMY